MYGIAIGAVQSYAARKSSRFCANQASLSGCRMGMAKMLRAVLIAGPRIARTRCVSCCVKSTSARLFMRVQRCMVCGSARSAATLSGSPALRYAASAGALASSKSPRMASSWNRMPSKKAWRARSS
ncbi:hypothetical protein D3C81_1540140 [compost metagenome]